ncbi:Hsp20/alpha crystallin family protein [Ectobacillus panaciterrae]|uniref:Hsp20/alpha crystallin family protein n=1 Tax=Ectobacillus panaciterrae TaxID=363872 RepID=UPI000406988F|nr:Hsp20/alpha crystallin family protein [Ectobacillus panaciterrae]
MDVEKLKQLMELAANVYGTNFWQDIFDQNYTNRLMGEGQGKMDFLKGVMPNAFENAGVSSTQNPNPHSKKNQDLNRRGEFPPIDIIKKAGKIVILIDLAGINKEDIELMFNKDYLIVKGVPGSRFKEGEIEVIYSERQHGAFNRQIPLPEPTDGTNISAKFYNGVLQVSYPLMEQKGDIIPIE